MNDITEPLRLAAGSHQAGTGMGCAMNVISWESGDKTITDFPKCADRGLAIMVQCINDHICEHRPIPTRIEEMGEPRFALLCPECSVKMLALAHRTVDTSLDHLDRAEQIKIYQEIGRRYLELLKAWPEGHTASEARKDIAELLRLRLRTGRAHILLHDVFDNYVWLLKISAKSRSVTPKSWMEQKIDIKLQAAHRHIDMFEEISGIKAPVVPPETVATAVKQMQEVRT